MHRRTVIRSKPTNSDAAYKEYKKLERHRADQVKPFMEPKEFGPNIDRSAPVKDHFKTGGRAAGGHWIQKAIKHPGSLRQTLHVKPGHDIPASKLEKAEHSSNPLTRKRARLAETLKGFHH